MIVNMVIKWADGTIDDENPQNMVDYTKENAELIEELLEVELEDIAVISSTYSFPDTGLHRTLWKVVYDKRKKVYERSMPGEWEWASWSHGNDSGCNAERVAQSYMSEVDKDPSVNLDKLVKNLVSDEHDTRVKYNFDAMNDHGNPFYDSTDSNHWREG